MKLSDTVKAVLKSKEANKVLFVTPDHSVYEAMERMAEEDAGALLVIANDRLAGGSCRSVIMPARYS